MAAGAQQSERMRRVGVLMPFQNDDPDWWINGGNVRIDTRWADKLIEVDC
jgi:hypothetical protein